MTGQTGAGGMPILVGAGGMPGAGAMRELGRLGAAVGKSEGVGLFAKGDRGAGRLGRPRGEADSLSSLPPPRPGDDVARGFSF